MSSNNLNSSDSKETTIWFEQIFPNYNRNYDVSERLEYLGKTALYGFAIGSVSVMYLFGLRRGMVPKASTAGIFVLIFFILFHIFMLNYF